MISSLAWIPKGAAKSKPVHVEISEQDIEAIKAAAKAELGAQSGEDISSDSEPESGDDVIDSSDEDMGEEEAVAKAKSFAASIKGSKTKPSSAPSPGGDKLASALAELDMDAYDDEDSGDDVAIDRIFGSANPGMAYHRNPNDDPYLKSESKNDDTYDSDADDDSEDEDLAIRDNDLLIMATRNEDDVSHLEVWVYEEPDDRGEGNLYVHHAVLLPAFPLSVAWGDCDPSGGEERKNIAAIGSFEPGIELWDLDVIDAVEPIATLGGADYSAARKLATFAVGKEEEEEMEETGKSTKDKKKKKKKKSKKSILPEIPVYSGSHTDAILGLSWNRQYRNVLASASADHTVKIWDVATLQASSTLTHHTDKVQAVSWNPVEAPILLSGGFDKKAALIDVRSADSSKPAAALWNLPSDVEAVAWDPHSPTRFAVSTESGEILFYDTQKGSGSAPLMTLKAHNKAATSLSYCTGVKNMILTASADKKIKIWGIDPGSTDGVDAMGQNGLLAEQDLKVGAVFAASFCRDAPLVVAAGGAKGSVAVWDTSQNEKIMEYAEKMKT